MAGGQLPWPRLCRHRANAVHIVRGPSLAVRPGAGTSWRHWSGQRQGPAPSPCRWTLMRTECGVESLSLQFPVSAYPGEWKEAGYNAILMASLAHSWVKDVRIHNAGERLALGPAPCPPRGGGVHTVLEQRARVYGSPSVQSFQHQAATGCLWHHAQRGKPCAVPVLCCWMGWTALRVRPNCMVSPEPTASTACCLMHRLRGGQIGAALRQAPIHARFSTGSRMRLHPVPYFKCA